MRKSNRRLFSLGVVFLFLSTIFLAPTGHSNDLAGKLGQERTRDGVRTTTFDSPQGKVRIHLPDDIRAGDTISGTISAEPIAQGSLQGMVIEIDGKQTRVSDRLIKFVVPAAAGVLSFKLVDGAGADASTATIPFKSSSQAPLSNFALPRIGQNGRRIEIPGPFDGDFSNTRCDVGGTRVAIIAESPRKAVIEIPTEAAGNTSINIADRGRTARSEFRIIAVALSAPKTRLAKGEKTTLTVTVSGLQGITENVPLDLQTSGVVETQGGNVQRIEIQPNQVKPDGTVVLTRGMTGLSAGNFTVVATVIDPASKPR